MYEDLKSPLHGILFQLGKLRIRKKEKRNYGYSIFLRNVALTDLILSIPMYSFASANVVGYCKVNFTFHKWQGQGHACDYGVVSNIPTHKVFIKQKRTRVTASGRVCTAAVGMIYDRRELSFRRVGLHRDVNEPHFRSPLVREVNRLKWPVHSGLFPKFRMPFYLAAEIRRSSDSENIGGNEIFTGRE